MKRIFIVLLMLMFVVNVYAQMTGGLVQKQKSAPSSSILQYDKLYSKEYLNEHYLALEEKQYSFGLDYLIKHRTEMKIYVVRKDTGATKYRLLKEWEVAKGRYIKSMIRLGYFIDLKTGDYKTFDEIVNGF